MRRNDSGLKAMFKNLKELDGVSIQAGIFKEAKAKKSANGSRADNLAYRLQIHDQGLGRNPERKVLEPAREKFIEDLNGAMLKHMKVLDAKGFNANSKLNALGKRFESQVKTAFRSPAKKAKAESTIKSAQRRYGGKRRNTPLIQMGEMRQAVSYRVK